MKCQFRVLSVNTEENGRSPQFRSRRSPKLAGQPPEFNGVRAGSGLALGRLGRRNWVGAGAGATPVSCRLCRHKTFLTRLARSWVSPAPAIPFHIAFRIAVSQPGKE